MRARFAVFALLLFAAPALAQDPNYTPDRTSAPMPPTVSFTNAPVWVKVPGSPVMVLQSDQRPGYDMFTLNNQYFIYKDNYWYRSDIANGPYVSLELNAIPPEMHTVPRASWVAYPAGWDAVATPGTTVASDWVPTMSFSTAPHWETIPGSSRVYYIRKSERPSGYDFFRYDTRYYTYQKGNWYSSLSTNGPYTLVTGDEVPTSFRTVKKTYWVNYPSGWTYMTPGAYNTTTKVKVKTETK